jgi:hypothetical protein
MEKFLETPRTLPENPLLARLGAPMMSALPPLSEEARTFGDRIRRSRFILGPDLAHSDWISVHPIPA